LKLGGSLPASAAIDAVINLRKSEGEHPSALMAGLLDKVASLAGNGSITEEEIRYLYRQLGPELLKRWKEKAHDDSKYYEREVGIEGLGYAGADAEKEVPYIAKFLVGKAGEPSNEQYVHAKAARALERLGVHAHAAVPELIKALTNTEPPPSYDLQYAVVGALGAFGKVAKTAVPALVKLLDAEFSRPGHQTIAALKKIGGGGDPQLHALLMKKLLSDSDHWDAKSMLEKLGDDAAPGMVPLLTKVALESKDEKVHEKVFDGLAALGSKAAVPILELIRQLPEGSRYNGYWALGRMGQSAAPVVDKLVAQLNGQIMPHWETLTTLGEIGPAAKGAIPAIQASAKKEMARPGMPYVRGEAVALALIGATDTTSVEIYREALKEKDDLSVMPLLGALVRAGAADDAIVKRIRDAVQSTEYATRSDALKVVGTLGKEAKPFLPAVLGILDGDRSDEALTVFRQLGIDAVPFLRESVVKDAKRRPKLLPLLLEIDPDRKSFLPELQRLATLNPDRQVRLMALQAIHHVENESRAPFSVTYPSSTGGYPGYGYPYGYGGYYGGGQYQYPYGNGANYYPGGRQYQYPADPVGGYGGNNPYGRIR
jgi:HEAT repeat protein